MAHCILNHPSLMAVGHDPLANVPRQPCGKYLQIIIWHGCHHQFGYSSLKKLMITRIPLAKSSWNFAHATTALLLWHMQNFKVIWLTKIMIWKRIDVLFLSNLGGPWWHVPMDQSGHDESWSWLIAASDNTKDHHLMSINLNQHKENTIPFPL